MDLADAAYNEFDNDNNNDNDNDNNNLPPMTLSRYLQQKGYDLIQHTVNDMPGYLGYYVALSQTEQVALIGVKGTSSLEDLITDMCGAAISYDLPDGPFITGGPTTIRAHEGVLLSSRRLADNLQPLVEKLLIPAGCRIVVVGHSLGAAAAALLAVLLQSRLPALRPSSRETAASSETPPLVQVYAFASPPTLDLQSAQACESFVTTIVNNCDVIPRCNVGPVLVTMELLKTIHEQLVRLKQQDEEEQGPEARKRLKFFAGVSSTWKFLRRFRRQLRKSRSSDTSDDDDDLPLVMTSEELAEAIDQALDKVGFNEEDQDQLYVPGKVVLMYNLWEEESKYHRRAQLAAKNKGTNPKDLKEYDYSGDRAVITKPTAKVLRYLEFDGRMVQDHMAPSYKSSLKALCSSGADENVPTSEATASS